MEKWEITNQNHAILRHNGIESSIMSTISLLAKMSRQLARIIARDCPFQ
jgi:hypothetical protein